MDHSKRLARTVATYGKARAARDMAIREAHAAGMSYRAIAEIVGLSYARVSQIVHGR